MNMIGVLQTRIAQWKINCQDALDDYDYEHEKRLQAEEEVELLKQKLTELGVKYDKVTAQYLRVLTAVGSLNQIILSEPIPTK